LDPDDLRPLNQIASITRQGDVTRVVTSPPGNDPSLLLSFACYDRPALWSSLLLVTPNSLLFVSAMVVALLTASLVSIGRDVFRQKPGTAHESSPASPWWPSALWLTALFLVVFSAKLLLMRENPLTVPYWDQWDAEANRLFVPFHECQLTWPSMFAQHNEHRIFFTRLLSLALLNINKQWDPRLEQVVNASIHALTAVLTAAMFWLATARRRPQLLLVVCALTFALPFSWENTLVGFQSSVYFAILFL